MRQDHGARDRQGLRVWPYTLLKHYPPPLWLHWLGARILNANFLLGVMGVIRNDADEILLFSHTYRGQPWALPGGWMKAGESPLAALEREVHEETGFQVQAERVLLIGTVMDRPKLEFVVAARLVGGDFRSSSEVAAAAWWAEERVPRPGRAADILEEVARLAPGEVGQYTMWWQEERMGRGGRR